MSFKRLTLHFYKFVLPITNNESVLLQFYKSKRFGTCLVFNQFYCLGFIKENVEDKAGKLQINRINFVNCLFF